MNTQPKVSVLISCYNYESFIAQSIESVLFQDYQGEVECIVVKDGSTDDSAARIAPYLGKIRYIEQENTGQPSAVNTGYRQSSGEVVFFLDADDFWRVGKISTVMERYRRQPDLGLVHHAQTLVDTNGAYINSRYERVTEPIAHCGAKVKGDGDIRALMMDQALPWMFNTTSSLSLPRALCELLFPLDESLRSYPDTMLASAGSLLAPVSYIDEPLGFYRIHGSNHSLSGKSMSLEEKQARLSEHNEVARIKLEFAASVMKKAGLTFNDCREASWDYLQFRARMAQRPFIFFLPETLVAIWKWRSAPLRIKMFRSYEITYKSIDRTLRGEWNKSL